MSTRCMRLSGISTARRISRTPPTMVKQWTHRQVLSTRLHHCPLPDRSSTTPTAVLRRFRRVLVRPAEDFRGRWTGLLMDGDFARSFSLLSLSLSLSPALGPPLPFPQQTSKKVRFGSICIFFSWRWMLLPVPVCVVRELPGTPLAARETMMSSSFPQTTSAVTVSHLAIVVALLSMLGADWRAVGGAVAKFWSSTGRRSLQPTRR